MHMFKKGKKITLNRVKDKNIEEYKMPFTYEFKGRNKRDYVILWSKTYDGLNLQLLDIEKQKRLYAHLFSRLEKEYWNIQSIEVDEGLHRLGLGTALLEGYFEIVDFLYSDTKIERIEGTVSAHIIRDKDALKFYKSLDGYITSNKKIINMQYDSQKNRFIYNLKKIKL